ncbi:septal ring lytic transglycosylase RlpA family protein [Marinilabiliaceae bacterium JC017]|nr:septal ring lytic transglycosylase RlpA family protein [Marinilabiliaceae bacterium JC017]
MKPVLLFVLVFLPMGLLAQTSFKQAGKASYYASKFEGRKTASGEIFSNKKLTAAHLSLPFGTRVKVTNPANGKSVVVKINDRGPYIKGRIIDLSQKAARKLHIYNQGVADVTIEVVNGKGPDEESLKRLKPLGIASDLFSLEVPGTSRLF